MNEFSDKIVAVIPCYNEEARLDHQQISLLLDEPRMNLLFVDDGSTDQTGKVIKNLAQRYPNRIEFLLLKINVGKAEAVRVGMLQAIKSGAPFVGYVDADFATPARDVLRISTELIEQTNIRVILGCRVQRLGSEIHRSISRHYLGRIFATWSSIILRMGVYDTQCGAKFFAASDLLRESLMQPFLSRWAFDVELIARLKYGVDGQPGYGKEKFLELPLNYWEDKSGSKLKMADKIKVVIEMMRITAYIWQLRKKMVE